jgi:two-component system, NarL family, sensor kinase
MGEHMTPVEVNRMTYGRRPRDLYTAAAFAAAVALIVIGQVRQPDQEPDIWVFLTAAIALSCTAMGWLVLAGVPGHRVGRLLLSAGIVATVSLVAASWTSVAPIAWLAQWSWCVPFGLILLALLIFPDGDLGSPWRRTLAVLLAATTSVIVLGWGVATLDPPYTQLLQGIESSTARGRTFSFIAAAAMAALVLEAVVVAAALLVRWRRATGETRQQVAYVCLAAAMLPGAIVLDVFDLEGAWIVVTMLVPAAMTLAILRFGLYGLDRIINRTIVWLIMTFLVIIGFVALVAILRDSIFGRDASTATAVATGAVAVAFQPALHRVQRGVNQLLYGDRDDPYRVVARLGDLLGHTVEPQAVPPLLAETIARSLRVPYVAVETVGRHGRRILAQHGTTGSSVEAFDMLARGERIGRLLVATRSPAARFTKLERRLLADLAQHAAVAVEATLLIHDLSESRERLVVAREEERHRLRRELHDGLGPTIAGMSMQVQAAQMIDAPARTHSILAALASNLQTCMAEVRHLVDQLRPPALDNGLAAALRAECRRFTGPDLAVTADVQTGLEGLPAAVDVAVYRIVAEALTNTYRHARATRCEVAVHKTEALVLTITDDGIGFTSAGRRGVGLQSMRERAEELGGSFAVSPCEPRGTSVRVRIPLRLDSRQVTEPPTEQGGISP